MNPKEPAVGSETRGGMMDDNATLIENLREAARNLRDMPDTWGGALQTTSHIAIAADNLERAVAALTHADARQEADAARYREFNLLYEVVVYLRDEDGHMTHRLRCGKPLDDWLDAAIERRALTQARGEGELNKGETMFKNYRKKNVQPMQEFCPHPFKRWSQ